MKISDFKPFTNPFVRTDDITISTHLESGKITEFRAVKHGKGKTFKVSNNKILDAWQQMEKWVGLI